MDNREEHPRVSVGTVQDWQKLKSHYKEAFFQAITQIASTQGLICGQDVAVAHMEQVCFFPTDISFTFQLLLSTVDRTNF